MRLIHTADWHLCHQLGKHSRTADLEHRVERVAELCEEHAVDVLLVAGDLFCDRADAREMTQSLAHIRKTFAPFFHRGGTLLAITGNHDHERTGRIDLAHAGMAMAAPTATANDLPGGRMYLVPNNALATLTSAAGHKVQFVCVPYPFANRYQLPPADGYRSKEAENRLLETAVAEWLAGVPKRPGFDPALPTVLVAHLQVRGAQCNSKYTLTEKDDICTDFATLNPSWAYVALGHIHTPQMLGGAEHVRYSGSLDRLDFGETHEGHGVLLVDIEGAAPVVPIHLPIPPTPFLTIEVVDPESELPTLAEKYPQHDSAIVKLVVHPPSSTSRDEIARKLRGIFPRIHGGIVWVEAAGVSPSELPAGGFAERAGFEQTVREYLHERLPENDGERDEVLALAETFLTAGAT